MCTIIPASVLDMMECNFTVTGAAEQAMLTEAWHHCTQQACASVKCGTSTQPTQAHSLHKQKHGFDRNMVLLLHDTALGIIAHYSITVMRQHLMSQIRNIVN